MKSQNRAYRSAWIVLISLWSCATWSDDRWYDLELNGHLTGYSHEISETDGNLQRTGSDTVLVLDREGRQLEMRMREQSIEDLSGLVSTRLESMLSGDSTVIEAVTADSHIHLTTTTSAGRYQRDLKITHAPLGPNAIRLQTLRDLLHDGDQFTYIQLREETAEMVSVTRALAGNRIAGQPFQVIERIPQESITRTATLDTNGELIESAEDSPLGHIVTRLNADVTGPHLVIGATIPVAGNMTASPRIDAPRTVQAMRLRVTAKDSALRLEDFQGPGQRAERNADGSLTLQMSPVGRDRASHIPPTAEERTANSLFPSDAPEIVEWAQQLFAPTMSVDARLTTLIEAVHGRLMFDPGFAVANALDVLRRGRGTCVAYATLTAALARAAHLPSRVVYGYVYADGAFIGHAWTEVWSQDHWRGVDAALYGNGQIDAARIALARSDGAAGPGSGLSMLNRTFDRFTVVPGALLVSSEEHPRPVPPP